ncbi:alpha-hydroxy acid oxidase [Kitasatospora mediocidica]|uniref:alpha-hydroxy acid oxidase n=1 Tax=Kitasatospora mediocidica TaxID=58352 RepID=UPI00056682E0|nr:alpha-hydroxy acid oxidase [Kitasatospora mediocidica]
MTASTPAGRASDVEPDDLEQRARAVLPGEVADFIAGGADDERTLRWEQQAFEDYVFEPRVLTGAREPQLAVSMLGTPVALPAAVAPMAYQRLVHPDGEHATVAGAAAAGALTVVPTLSSVTLEAAAERAAGPLWFQLYCLQDRELTASLVRRAEAAGYRAIVVTVDAPRLGRRRRDERNGFTLPADVEPANLAGRPAGRVHTAGRAESALAVHAAATHDASLSWADLAWLRSLTGLPLVLKGVLSVADAERAVQEGAAGIVVSSHGGRQLDRVPAALHALPEIVHAVGDRIEVYLDGGVRQGADVLTALGLGARAVFIGRPVLWGLAAGGADGVTGVLDRIRDELAHTLVLAGREGVGDLDGLVRPRGLRHPLPGSARFPREAPC